MEETMEDKPSVTAEEFQELRGMQAQQTFLQAQGYQVYSIISSLDFQYEQLKQRLESQMTELEADYQNRIVQGKDQLASLQNDLDSLTTTFTERFKTIVTNYGFENVDSVAISDTEPHYITPVELNPASE